MQNEKSLMEMIDELMVMTKDLEEKATELKRGAFNAFPMFPIEKTVDPKEKELINEANRLANNIN